MDSNTVLELLGESTHINFDNAERIRMPTLVRGLPGTVEYRGMPWLRGLFIQQITDSLSNNKPLR